MERIGTGGRTNKIIGIIKLTRIDISLLIFIPPLRVYMYVYIERNLFTLVEDDRAIKQ